LDSLVVVIRAENEFKNEFRLSLTSVIVNTKGLQHFSYKVNHEPDLVCSTRNTLDTLTTPSSESRWNVILRVLIINFRSGVEAKVPSSRVDLSAGGTGGSGLV